jgi:ParB-like chromosome segregation protein Spo0J
MKLQTIILSTIQFDDDLFSLTPSLVTVAPEKLVRSISRVGLLHPPIIVEIAEGIYRIASGRRRLLAARKLNVQSCKCTVFSSTTHPMDVFNYIYEDASHTNLSIISKAIFLRKAGKWLSDEELSKKFMAGFELKGGAYQISKLKQLAELEINIQEALFAGRIDEKVCHELVKLDFIDRMGLFDVIQSLSLSVANQRKLLITSRELAARNEIHISSFLGQEPLTTILSSNSLNAPQKSTAYMTRLQELRFPLLSEAEHEFKLFIKELSLPKQIQVAHDTSFETDKLTITITCQSKKELQKTVSLLAPQN